MLGAFGSVNPDDTGGNNESVTGIDTAEWESHDGAQVDADRNVERSPGETEFQTATGESLLVSYLAGSQHPMFVVDDEGTFTHTNEACRQLFDCGPGDMIGTNIFDYDEAEDDELRDVLENGVQTHGVEDTVELPDETMHLSRSFLPLYNRDAEVCGALVIIRDISARIRAQRRERQLEEYQSEVIEEFQQLLGQLSGGDYMIEPSIPDPQADFDRINTVHERFETMTDDLTRAVRTTRTALREARTVSDELASIRDEVLASTDETRDSMDEFEETIKDVAESVTRQSEQAQTAEESADDLSASIEEVAASANEVAKQAEHAQTLTEEAATEAETAIENMERAMDATDENVEYIDSLQDQMVSVADMSELIDDIAEQTNLLALNASIEAARADADGSGFEVIADEIKQLSSESQETAGEITDQIATLQKNTEETATVINRSATAVSTG
jgi:methyl-accepting chemotaxis protein